MTSQEKSNLAVVQSAYAELTQGNMDGFFAVMAEDVEFHEAPSLPYAGVYRGIESVRRGAGLMFAAWEDFRFEVQQYGAGGDVVFVHVLISGIGRKTGKSFSMPIVELWRLRKGKVSEVRPFYFDTARCVECFG